MSRSEQTPGTSYTEINNTDPEHTRSGLDDDFAELRRVMLEDLPSPNDDHVATTVDMPRILETDQTRGDMGKLVISAAAHKEMADVFGNPVPETKEAWRGRIKYRDPDPDLTPRSFSQQSQSNRAARRQAKANSLSSREQYRLQQIYGKDVGTQAYKERVEAERTGLIFGKGHKRKALKAHDEFIKRGEQKARLEGKVKRSASGEDIPGRVLTWRINRKPR